MKLMLLSAALAYIETIAASLGNTFPTYKSCVESCSSDICSSDGYYFANPQMISLPLLFLWKCSDDCQYRCMWGVVETFQKKGWPPPQFHGKISMNGWVWSAIFHSRDTPFTELMDYLSAFGLVFSSAYGIGMRLLLYKRRLFSIAFTFLCLLFYVNHAIYLSSGLFDYKYNLFANIIVGKQAVLLVDARWYSGITVDVGNSDLSALYKRSGPLHPSPDFARHQIIRPRVYHAREKREISSSRKEKGTLEYIHDVTVVLELNGKPAIVDLSLNRELLPKNYFVKTQENGSHVVHRRDPSEIELCQYQGNIRGIPTSWAALSTCSGIRGVIHDGETLHYIEKSDTNLSDISGEHFVYKHDDLLTNNTCGYEGTPHDVMESVHRLNTANRVKRSPQNIRGPYNANRRSRFVELILVVDHRLYENMNKDLNEVKQRCKDIANIINALYTPLNIFIALVGVVVWTELDEITLSTKGDTTLTNFLHYRREKLVKEHPNDNAQLLTKIQFDGGVVGKALKGPMCTYEFSGGVSMDHSTVVGLVATTVTHEMGHNFGMEHDTQSCDCPDDRCIMAPSSSTTSPTHWSSCSLEYLAVAFDHGMDYCLKNKPERLFDSPVCGNGFVEAGEQCDCGLEDRCNNPCCNATRCMLYSNASCATGECCDLSTCHPKNAGSLCRSADHECDLPEYCTGESEYCPGDVFKMDGETCDWGKAFCYKGTCRSHSDQCRLLWGPSGKSSDFLCYRMNTKGSRHGNCGYNRLNQSYVKCYDENIFCGMLHCMHLNERLEFGMESVSILSHSFINAGGNIIPCRTAIVDLGLNEIDPGLAPDGAKCAEGKMCVGQKCLSVDALTAGTACKDNCNGNGVCNSLGHCHCNTGFAPPTCHHPGTGGSEDSGPASQPNARREVITAFYIVFLGVLPSIALVGFFLYYMKRNTIFVKKPRPTMYVNRCNTKDNKRFNVVDYITTTTTMAPTTSSTITGGTTARNNSKTVIAQQQQQQKNLLLQEEPIYSEIYDQYSVPMREQDHYDRIAVIENIYNEVNAANSSLLPRKSMITTNSTNKPIITKSKLIFTTNEQALRLISAENQPTIKQYHEKKPVTDTRNNHHHRGVIGTGGKVCRAPSASLEISGPLIVDHSRATLLPRQDSSGGSATVNGGGEVTASHLQNNLLRHFVGFSTTSLQKEPGTVVIQPPAAVVPVRPHPTAVGHHQDVHPSVSAITPVHPVSNVQKNVPIRPAPKLPEVNVPPVAVNSLSVNQSQLAHQQQRPVISSPVLAATTSTAAKDLIDHGHSPSRPAPAVPGVEIIQPKGLTAKQHPVQQQPPPVQQAQQPQTSAGDDKKTYPALTRIASFMRGQKPEVQKKDLVKKKLDKEALRNIEISNPIPQKDIEIPLATLPVEKAVVVSRAQSLRDTAVVKRAPIPTFGSMRMQNGKRPTSTPAAHRPTSPPPRPPSSIGVPGYQPPSSQSIAVVANKTDNSYDDCLNLLTENNAPLAHIDEESPKQENIYAVIEENPQATSEYKVPNPVDTSGDTMGLLGEIVLEIEARNNESIYSASTLKRKKENCEDDTGSTVTDMSSDSKTNQTYMNTSSNSSNSGYLSPINSQNKGGAEQAVVNKGPTVPEVSAPYKPYSSSLHRNNGPFAASYNRTPTPELKAKNEPNSISVLASKTSVNTTKTSPSNNTSFNRTKTPPSLQRRKTPPNLSVKKLEPINSTKKSTTDIKKSSTTTTPSSKNQNTTTSATSPQSTVVTNATNSLASKQQPDIVSSCTNDANKAPDVVVKQEKPKVLKSTLKQPPTGPKPQIQSTKPKTEFNNTNKSYSGGKPAVRSNSKVASLQQKFENQASQALMKQNVDNSKNVDIRR
ncbi:uncharacterized protein isoform X3 [Rhodnius prolixus]|uniref:uncharacterized protein isoform X3 n=1 Tax=Rhodnius prolixus TaxID=13249 RepID=UPI003D1893F3